ncbi:carboxymuconolactone decarboxylase family protein [Puniceibacterium sp. IMCC21224]|uniref:carboxymuconolactone decarboxylase family protein n=1 Tax=Puniceibacterium sp. IMCC21224 TaxID=1618204 RepID=UPI00064E060A|nr:carboxymuconolactone decarboxylase family protein [Puniceibacterium sp. IMCC21224]KMK65929.1 carboxymuconolactone decarboxylase family protein [Puniceibacterium sp. IMCC21224]
MTDWPTQRLNAPDPATYSNRQKAVHDAIASGPRGGVRGPLAVWLHRAELGAKAQDLGQYCRYDSSLEPRLSELAILVMARTYSAEYEWYAHKPIALKAGLSPQIVEAIRTGSEPVFTDPEEEVVYLVARSALDTRQVPDDLYARAEAVLGTDRLVDLVGVLGYYSLISLTLNIFRVSPPSDAPKEFE